MVSITKPELFNFQECLWFLDRGLDECLYRVGEEEVLRFLNIANTDVLISISENENSVNIEILKPDFPSGSVEQGVKEYVTDWFDMRRDIKPFYQMSQQNALLSSPTTRYEGLRLMGINDVFEGLCWSVIGQQINLTFAYKMKRALVEKYGQTLVHSGTTYLHFPRPDILKDLSIEELKKLQFSRQKADYVISLANEISDPDDFKKGLMQMSLEGAVEELMKLRGIGLWSAQYVAMKTLRFADAFPSTDAGLINAIKLGTDSKTKPDQNTIVKIGEGWKGWRAYATLYLWRSLSDKRP